MKAFKVGDLLERKHSFPNATLGKKALIVKIENNLIYAISEKGHLYQGMSRFVVDNCFIIHPSLLTDFSTIGGWETITEKFNDNELEEFLNPKYDSKIIHPAFIIRTPDKIEKKDRYLSRDPDLEYIEIIQHLYPDTFNLQFNHFKKCVCEDIRTRSKTRTRDGNEIYMLINIFSLKMFKTYDLFRDVYEWSEVDIQVQELICAIFNILPGDGEEFWEKRVVPKKKG